MKIMSRLYWDCSREGVSFFPVFCLIEKVKAAKYSLMNNRKHIILFLCALFSFFGMKAQVTVDAKLDSALMFIGQRMGILLEVSADKGKAVEMPHYDSLQNIVPGLEYVYSTPVDTEYVNDGKRMIIRSKYYVTSFDTAIYSIPPFRVKIGDKEFESNKLAMKVLTFDIDTTNVDKIFPIKDVMSPPFEWREWSTVFWLSVIAVILALILIYVAIRLKDNKPIIRRIKVKQRLAPHKAAMQKIEHIKEEKLTQSEDSKEYYTRLTDTLRQYIDERYGFNAMEMTTAEIIQHLSDVNDPEAIGELRELFETADLVKFAKYSTLINENDRNLVNAIEYINQTKQEETEQKPQPEEIVIVDKRSKTAKITLIICVTVAAVVLIAVVCYLLYRLNFLLV